MFGIFFISLFSVQSQTELRWIEFSYQRNWHIWSETNLSSSTDRVSIFSSISSVQLYVYYATLCIFFSRVWNFPFAKLVCVGCMRIQPTVFFEKLNLYLNLTARNGDNFSHVCRLVRVCKKDSAEEALLRDLVYCPQQQLVFLLHYVPPTCTVIVLIAWGERPYFVPSTY